MHFTPKPFISILGPTATGKTKLGVSIAKAIRGEVISIDSLQCYQPGSIVTAKVQDKEADGIPHHLVDYLEADEEPHDYVALAIQKMEAIRSRGCVPVLVGGSTSLTIPVLHAAYDCGYKPLAILLRSPALLHKSRMEKRIDEMVCEGLLDEMRELKDLERQYLIHGPDFTRGIWKTIGYGELYPYLLSSESDAGDDVSSKRLLRQGLTAMKENTVRYARSQLDWMERAVVPFLRKNGASYMCLTVRGTGTSFDAEVVNPAVWKAKEFCIACGGEAVEVRWASLISRSIDSSA